MTSPTIADALLTTQFTASGLYDNGNSGANFTVNWLNADRQKLTISASTTITYSGAVAGQILSLLIVENGTGNFSITLPSSKWSYGSAGVFTTTPNAINILTVFFDGTNYNTALSAGFA
jgi:beta-xylosidase